jgi:hypothetical protein
VEERENSQVSKLSYIYAIQSRSQLINRHVPIDTGNASFASQPKAGPSKKRKTAKVDDGEESDLTDIDDQEEDELEEESEEEPEEDDNVSETGLPSRPLLVRHTDDPGSLSRAI